MANFISVSKERFYATVGKLNVHPHILPGRYDRVNGYGEHWKLPDGRMIGRSIGGTVYRPYEYEIDSDYFSR